VERRSLNARADVSVILPVFDEAESLPILWQELEEVLRWLAQYERKATGGMFRVPTQRTEAEGVAPR